jgi:hypothetical protein
VSSTVPVDTSRIRAEPGPRSSPVPKVRRCFNRHGQGQGPRPRQGRAKGSGSRGHPSGVSPQELANRRCSALRPLSPCAPSLQASACGTTCHLCLCMCVGDNGAYTCLLAPVCIHPTSLPVHASREATGAMMVALKLVCWRAIIVPGTQTRSWPGWVVNWPCVVYWQRTRRNGRSGGGTDGGLCVTRKAQIMVRRWWLDNELPLTACECVHK